MIDLNKKSVKFATRIGAVVTILVLGAACSSKQVLNESSFPEPVEYTDSTSNESPYVDQSELPKELEEARPKKVAKSVKKKWKKKQRRKVREEALPAIGSIDKSGPSMPSYPAEPLIASNDMIPAPPAPQETPVLDSLEMESPSLTEPVLVSDLLWSWYSLAGLLALAAFGWFVFKKSSPKKSKRKLVFN